MATWPRGLEPIDLITGLYLLASGSLAVAWYDGLDQYQWLAWVFILGALVVFTLPPWLRKKDKAWSRALAAWYPVLSFTLFYLSTAPLNQASPLPSLDPWLEEMDVRLFNEPFCHLFSRNVSSPIFAEAMAFFYFSYYALLPGLSVYLWIRNRRLFYSFVFCTGLCFYVFFLFFSIVPSGGPQFHIHGGSIHWNGTFFGPLLTAILLELESSTGAFPSSHVGITLIVTAFAFRQHRALGWVLALFLTGLAAATQYGGPHYFIDLPCGAAVGFLFLKLCNPCQRALEAFLGK